MRNALFTTLVVALLAVAARADVTVSTTMGLVNGIDKANGQAITNGTYAMILDLNGNGLNGGSYLTTALPAADWSANKSWLADPGDMLLDIGAIDSSNMAFPTWHFTGNPATGITGYDAGADNIYVMWFDTPYVAGAAGPGAGVHYGAELLGVAPSDTGNFTPDAVGGNAALTTTPEPMSLVIMLVGGALVAARRRRNG